MAEGINHFSVGIRKCLMEEVVFELNLEEWVKACAHELRWGWKAHSRQRKKRANKASLSAKLNSLFLSTHTLSRLHTFNRGVLPVLFSLDKSYHFLRAAEVDHPEDTIAEAPVLSPSVSPSSPPS